MTDEEVLNRMECRHKTTGKELEESIDILCEGEYEWIQAKYTCGDVEQIFIVRPELCVEGERVLFESKCCSEFEYETKSNQTFYAH